MGIMRWLVKSIDNKFGYDSKDSDTTNVVKAGAGGFIEGCLDGVFLTGVMVFVVAAYMKIKQVFKSKHQPRLIDLTRSINFSYFKKDGIG